MSGGVSGEGERARGGKIFDGGDITQFLISQPLSTPSLSPPSEPLLLTPGGPTLKLTSTLSKKWKTNGL